MEPRAHLRPGWLAFYFQCGGILPGKHRGLLNFNGSNILANNDNAHARFGQPVKLLAKP